VHGKLRCHHGSLAIANGFAPTSEAAGLIAIITIVTRRPGTPPELELHQEEIMSQLGWILGSVSRGAAVGRTGNPGRIAGRSRRARETTHRRRVVDLGWGLGAEPLEVRALLSGQTVSLIKDVNAVETDPVNLDAGRLEPVLHRRGQHRHGRRPDGHQCFRDPGSAGYQLAGLEGLVR
jgi:hypothetical protein